MHIVLTAATTSEINTTATWLEGMGRKLNGNTIEVVYTGIGGTAAAYAITSCIHLYMPDLIVQAGIAGSFNDSLSPGSLAFVHEEVFADLGVVENNELTDIFDLGLAADNEKPFVARMLLNPSTEKWSGYGLPFVRGATVNCISSSYEQINLIRKKYNPDLESMEGAALHYICLIENIPFLQLRAVSNLVGERNKKNWKMKEAIESLNKKLKIILSEL